MYYFYILNKIQKEKLNSISRKVHSMLSKLQVQVGRMEDDLRTLKLSSVTNEKHSIRTEKHRCEI